MESTLLHTPPTTNITSQPPSFLLLPSVEEAGENLISGWALLSLAPLASRRSEHGSLAATGVCVCVLCVHVRAHVAKGLAREDRVGRGNDRWQ